MSAHGYSPLPQRRSNDKLYDGSHRSSDTRRIAAACSLAVGIWRTLFAFLQRAQRKRAGTYANLEWPEMAGIGFGYMHPAKPTRGFIRLRIAAVLEPRRSAGLQRMRNYAWTSTLCAGRSNPISRREMCRVSLSEPQDPSAPEPSIP